MAKEGRKELPPPPHVVITWCVLFAYIVVGLEGAFVAAKHPWRSDLSLAMEKTAEDEARVCTGQAHICLIYIFEILLACGPGWCAMSPGWTRSDLLIHHLP